MQVCESIWNLCTFCNKPLPLQRPLLANWQEHKHTHSHNHTRPPCQFSASYGEKLWLPKGCGSFCGLTDECCRSQVKTEISYRINMFSFGSLDCRRCCGLGLRGARQQTLSHPGRGPWWTCSCCWHEGKNKRDAWRASSISSSMGWKRFGGRMDATVCSINELT